MRRAQLAYEAFADHPVHKEMVEDWPHWDQLTTEQQGAWAAVVGAVRHSLPLGIGDIQTQQKEWADVNFPDSTSDVAFLGLTEEVGEMAHAFRCQKQGIRGSASDHELAAKDAAGDVFIFLCHLSTLHGWDLEAIINDTWLNVVKKRDWKADPFAGTTAPPAEVVRSVEVWGTPDMVYTVRIDSDNAFKVYSKHTDMFVYNGLGTVQRAIDVAKLLNNPNCRFTIRRASADVPFQLWDRNHKVEVGMFTEMAEAERAQANRLYLNSLNGVDNSTPSELVVEPQVDPVQTEADLADVSVGENVSASPDIES